jgi:hypothetical protein
MAYCGGAVCAGGGGGVVVAVLSWVQDAGQGAEGVLGDLGVDGGLLAVFVPEHLDVERGEQAGLQGGRQAGQDVAGEGELTEQGGVGGGRGCLVEGFELGFGLFAFVVEAGCPGRGRSTAGTGRTG